MVENPYQAPAVSRPATTTDRARQGFPFGLVSLLIILTIVAAALAWVDTGISRWVPIGVSVACGTMVLILLAIRFLNSVTLRFAPPSNDPPESPSASNT